MTFFCFCHAQKNAFAFLVALPFRQIAVRLCGLDFRLPIALCDFDRLLRILWLGGHAELKRKKCILPRENSQFSDSLRCTVEACTANKLLNQQARASASKQARHALALA